MDRLLGEGWGQRRRSPEDGLWRTRRDPHAWLSLLHWGLSQEPTLPGRNGASPHTLGPPGQGHGPGQVRSPAAPVRLGPLVATDLPLGQLIGEVCGDFGPQGCCSGCSAVLYSVPQSLKRKEKEYEHEMERLAREKIATQQRLAELKHELSQWMDVLEIDRVLRQTGQPEDDQASTSTASGEPRPPRWPHSPQMLHVKFQPPWPGSCLLEKMAPVPAPSHSHAPMSIYACSRLLPPPF